MSVRSDTDDVKFKFPIKRQETPAEKKLKQALEERGIKPSDKKKKK